MQTITQIATLKMLGNQKVIGRLMALFNKSSFTITRWIEARDVRLTTKSALEIICEETDLDESQVLEAEKTAA